MYDRYCCTSAIDNVSQSNYQTIMSYTVCLYNLSRVSHLLCGVFVDLERNSSISAYSYNASLHFFFKKKTSPTGTLKTYPAKKPDFEKFSDGVCLSRRFDAEPNTKRQFK